MPVNNEIIIGRVVIDAHARLRCFRVGKLRDELAKERATPRDEFFFDLRFIRIDLYLLSLMMIGYLHRARVMNGEAVEPAMKLDEDGETARIKVACAVRRWLKVYDALPRGSELVREKREKPARPRPRSYHQFCALEFISRFGNNPHAPVRALFDSACALQFNNSRAAPPRKLDQSAQCRFCVEQRAARIIN